MSLGIEIEDGRYGTRNKVGVTQRGQLTVAPIGFNETHFNSMTVVTIAYNFIEPIACKQFVLDGIIFSSDKNVSSTNGAVITIYEADAIDSNTASKELFQLDIGRLDKGSITGLNLITNPGVWINGSTDDTTTNVTLIGYYVDEIK